jgi:hypothetical protein
LSKRTLELAANEDTKVLIKVNEEVFGAVLINKENDAISTETSHARSSLSEMYIAFGHGNQHPVGENY